MGGGGKIVVYIRLKMKLMTQKVMVEAFSVKFNYSVNTLWKDHSKEYAKSKDLKTTFQVRVVS